MHNGKKQNTRFFFGCNTPSGFKGFLEDLYDPLNGWQVLLIKGSPGNGKNSVMKKVLHTMRLRGEPCEEIYCSSDPSSLDGVIVPGRKRAIFDATAPHVMEPRYWGVCESVLDLSHCLNTDRLLEKSGEILSLTNACSAQHKSCCLELCKASFMENGLFAHAEKQTDFDRVMQEACRLSAELFGDSSALSPCVQRRFLSAVTPEGIVFFGETLDSCEKVYTLYDPFGAFSSVFLSVLCDRGEKAGERVISCRCPLSPERIEHLLFPNLSVGFTVLNDRHRYRSILRADYSYTDFLKNEIVPLDLSGREFLENAVEHLKKAKNTHDELEKFYADVMNWDALNEASLKAVAFMERKKPC